MFKYLERLSEDFIFEKFKEELNMDSSNPFTDFTQFHRDIFLRLKLKALNGKLTAS